MCGFHELFVPVQPAVGQAGEARMPAHASSLRQQGPSCTSVLEQGDAELWGSEHLLAALECCGVDNARIEIEGGKGGRSAMMSLHACLHE